MADPIRDNDPPLPSRGDELRQAAAQADTSDPRLAQKLRRAAALSDARDRVLREALGRP